MPPWLGPMLMVVLGFFLLLVVASFDTLEYQELGLRYSWIAETIDPATYRSGRYYLGLGNHFIKFPAMVKPIYFEDQPSQPVQGPAVRSRTADGLNVLLEISFQYKLIPEKLYDLYTILGDDYEKTFVRIAIEQLTSAATFFDANSFFVNRTVIGPEMHEHLRKHFLAHVFADVPFFQLRTVHLPTEFEEAIQETQVKQQDIQIAQAEQMSKKVQFATKVIQAEQQVKVMTQNAEAEAKRVLLNNGAFCKQYTVTQEKQVEALKAVMKASAWNGDQLLDYLAIRAIRDHPAEKMTIGIA